MLEYPRRTSRIYNACGSSSVYCYCYFVVRFILASVVNNNDVNCMTRLQARDIIVSLIDLVFGSFYVTSCGYNKTLLCKCEITCASVQ